MQRREIAITVFVLLMLTVVIPTYMPFAEVYGKHKSDNNNLLPTGNRGRNTLVAVNEYIDPTELRRCACSEPGGISPISIPKGAVGILREEYNSARGL
jgi:hypothetical protein